MAEFSFTREWVLDEKQTDQLMELLDKPIKTIKIDRSLTSHEEVNRGKDKILEILAKLQ